MKMYFTFSATQQCILTRRKDAASLSCVNGVIAFLLFILAGFTKDPYCVLFAVAVLCNLHVCMEQGRKQESGAGKRISFQEEISPIKRL